MKAATVARSTLAIAGMAIAGLLIAGTAAGAQGFGGGPGPGSGFGSHRSPLQRTFALDGGRRSWWNNPRIVERLKLTDDQRKAMDGIMQQHRVKLIDLHANLDKAELAMQPLMSADTPDDAAITAQIDKIIQARGDLERANSLFLLAIRDKLTPDQWKQVQAFRDNRDMRRGQGPGMQGPGGRFRGQQPPPPTPEQQSAPATGPGSGDQQ
ncbi:MAG TPA: Spy/CpxP family protein refolding chaperone [Terracidiphilus sp.]|jgi:periplasmic protein CpxP/Spy|nr:Spy/CpxP family protein refolding chaperone [Terracidiphilus sp.]